MTETEIRPLLHSPEATSKILGGVVSADWLKDHKNQLHCTILGRFLGFTAEQIARNLAENAFAKGRKVGRSSAKPK
jgi:hypothetical protein